MDRAAERGIERWLRVAAWATLPLTAGGALADTTGGWATAPQLVAAGLAWGAWAVGLLALLAPRPPLLTAIRAIATGFVVVAVVVAGSGEASAAASAIALAAALLAAALVARPGLAASAANAVAYGDETRYPLRVPPGLFLGPLPLARTLLVTAVVAGPLLLADRRWVLGAAAIAVGVPVAAVAVRALHGLSTRWVVMVPAGLVVVDGLTLADPVLFPRERIAALAPVGPEAGAAGPDVHDLRLGASLGTLSLRVDRDAELFLARRGRRGATTVRTREVWVAVQGTGALLADASRRRIPVVGRAAQAAMPPPTSSSSS